MNGKDFLDQVDWFTDKFGGKQQTDDEIIDRFALNGAENRIAMLHQIEGEELEDISTPNEIRKAARRMKLVRQMNETHSALLKAGR
ncbi:hypothetical protein J4G43_002365 [Bradyrhizobium barranii subsp. barranii]|uniref:Uncharacterized protein n=1 Tax=Bradyrhizobium barranii subsp. barranii TaxID=2823807 RepID=A0A939RW21_9BRAD|nr:hypothetical protein [Bradyrhizobium barranii]UEM13220.1 hypothetical protein J4G43_002365 [Bradyrhizobium barranii subsp. barranii]